MPVVVGVLALQGGYDPHVRSLERLRVKAVKVKSWAEIDQVDALVIPGGESTTIGKLLHIHGLLEPLRAKIQDGLPVFGTCAGMILLSKKAEGMEQPLLGVLDVTVLRNAYGSQTESYEAKVELVGQKQKSMLGIFIRAPRITEVGPEVKTVALYEGVPVCVRQGNLLAASFHPELTEDLSLHRYFMAMVAETVPARR